MKLSSFNWLIVALSAAMSIFGFWGFATTLTPIPEQLHFASGTIASAEAQTRKGRIRTIRFKVDPGGAEFSYPGILRNTAGVWDRIDRGVPVEVLYAGDGKPELWGLRLAGETMITPESAYAARRENGYWGLAIGFGFFGSCMYMLFIQGRRITA